MADQTRNKEKYSEIVAREKLALEKQEEVAKKLPGRPIRNSQDIRPIEEIIHRPTESAEHEILESEEIPQADPQMLEMENMHKFANILNRANGILVEATRLELDNISSAHLVSLKNQIKELAFQVLMREHILFGEMFDESTD